MFKRFAVATSLLAVLACFTPAASARVFVRGVVRIGPAFYGPVWAGPGWWYPGPYAVAPATGSVKFQTNLKDPAVYINGGYAGTIGQLKTFQMRPGTYHIELRDHDGHQFFHEEIHVIAGKTLKLTV